MNVQVNSLNKRDEQRKVLWSAIQTIYTARGSCALYKLVRYTDAMHTTIANNRA